MRAERRGDELRVTLTRPAARNALDVRMRDELLDALAVAVAAPELQVVVDGEGEAFCAGGDLDEFGTRPDVSTAHLVRLRRSLGAVLLALAPRTTVLVHGPSAGSGVELAAFAGRVVAQPDATFLLPELRMGLVPGAGGTVSLPRRIGRHATMGLCLAAGPIDAAAAVALGLVDEIRA
ncbi:MAG: enoyl-CoA hydratase/isomerase family protein [Acidimicrobiales bacterium]